MILIRNSTPADLGAIEALYPEAFPDEDLLPLVRDLLGESSETLSLVAAVDSSLVGHVVFTTGSIEGHGSTVALLGPLAVSPASQRQGIGSALVREGLQRLGCASVGLILVLGDPAYYSRLGFEAERRVVTPYELPAEWRDAWQSLPLGKVAAPASGKLILPRPWQNSALWAP